MSKVGLFDSSFGGLVLMRDIVNRLPLHDFVYLGDTAHTPYGNRPASDIYAFTRQGVEFLLKQDCDIVVILCNSADSNALGDLQRNYLPAVPGKFIIGVIAPALAVAASKSNNKKIGAIGTEATVKSGALPQELAALQTVAQLYQQATPMLVPLIEAGQQNGDSFQALLRTYLAPLQAAGIDTLLLACTHYGLVKQQVQAVVGDAVTVIDEGRPTAERLADFLARHPELEARLGKNSQRQFYCTQGGKKGFDLIGSEFYGTPIAATQVTI